MSIIQSAIFRIVSVNNNSHILLAKRFTTSALNSSKVPVEEKLGITRRPKRPTTAFFSFVKDRRPLVAQQNPEAKQKDLIKLISVEWRNLDQTKKEELQEKFKKDWAEYTVACKKYDEMLSPGEKEKIKMLKEEAKITEAKKYIKKKRAELGCPKKPASSYMYYLKSKLSERGEEPYNEFQKKVIKAWETLPPSEKQRFEEMYKKDLEDYREKLSEWNRKMLEKGIKDVEPHQLPPISSFEAETVKPKVATESKKLEINQINSSNNQLGNKKIIYISLISTCLAVIISYAYIVFY